MMRKALSCLLAVSLVIFMIPQARDSVSAAGEIHGVNATDSTAPLLAASSTAVWLNSFSDPFRNVFRFVPAQSAIYTITTSSAGNTRAWLLNGSGYILAEDDSSGVNGAFKITHNLTAGVTYYIDCCSQDIGAGSFIAATLSITFTAETPLPAPGITLTSDNTLDGLSYSISFSQISEISQYSIQLFSASGTSTVGPPILTASLTGNIPLSANVIGGTNYCAKVMAVALVASVFSDSPYGSLSSSVTASAAKSSAKAITSLSVGTSNGLINETNHTIVLYLPTGTNVTSLSPTIISSALSSVSPASGAAVNLTNPVEYTVTAENNSTQTYTVSTVLTTVLPNGSASSDTTCPIITAGTTCIPLNSMLRTTTNKYRFIPLQTATYTFTTIASGNTYGCLYDSSGTSTLLSMGNTGVKSALNFSYALTSNMVYYLDLASTDIPSGSYVMGVLSITGGTLRGSTVTVSYNAGTHGSLAGATNEYLYSGDHPVYIPSVTPDSQYFFTGWSSNGGTTVLNNGQILLTTANADITYTAQYVLKPNLTAPGITLSSDTTLGGLTYSISPLSSEEANISGYTIQLFSQDGTTPVGSPITTVSKTGNIPRTATVSGGTLYSAKVMASAVSAGTYSDSIYSSICSPAVCFDTRSAAKTILNFTIGSFTGTIDNTNHTVLVTMPYGTALTTLAPSILVSPLAAVSPVSGAAKNFSSSVIYTVTAENETTQAYTVSIINESKPLIDVTGNVTDTETWVESVPLSITASAESGIKSVTVNGDDITATYSAGYIATTNGIYTYAVTSNIGSTSEFSVSVTQIDTVKPVISIDSNGYSEGDWSNADVVLDLSDIAANLGTTTYSCSADGINWWIFDGTLTVQTDSDNTYQFRVVSESGITSDIASFHVKVDKSEPTDGQIKVKSNIFSTFLNTITFGLFFNETLDVSITGDCGLSGQKSIEYQRAASAADYDASGTWTSYSAPFSVPTDEKFIIYARITDNAGNSVILSTDGIITDSTDPTLSLTADSTWQAGDSNVAVSANDNLAGIDEITYTTNEPVPQTGTLTLTAGEATVSLVNTGAYSLTVSARDKSGNETIKSIDIKMDKTLPLQPVITDAAQYTGTQWYNTNKTISAAFSVTTGSAEKLQYRLNSGTWTDGKSVVVSAEGVNTVAFRVIDELGGTHVSEEATVQIDKSAPANAKIKVKGNTFSSFLNSITFGLFFSETLDASIQGDCGLSGQKSIEYQRVASAADYQATGNWTPYTGSFSVVPDAAFIIYARITDNAGNSVILSTDGIITDNTDPSLTLFAGSEWQSGDTNASVTVSDALSEMDIVTYSTNESVPQTGTVALFNGTGAITLNHSGAYTLTVKAIDRSGNETVTSVNVKIDKTLPNQPIIANAEQYANSLWNKTNQTLTADFVVTTGCTEILQYKLNNGTWVTGSSLEVSAEGVNAVSFRVIDELGRTSALQTVTVQMDKSVPTPTATPIPTPAATVTPMPAPTSTAAPTPTPTSTAAPTSENDQTSPSSSIDTGVEGASNTDHGVDPWILFFILTGIFVVGLSMGIIIYLKRSMRK